MSDDVVRLARPGEVGEKPSVTLHLMVKNGESVVGRLLDNVGPYVSEVVAVLNDCEDDTAAELDRGCWRNGVQQLLIQPVTYGQHPDLYIRDLPATYDVGRPLVGESYEGPFTGHLILADWAAARNLGWGRGSGEWRLFLDADDVVQDPECLPGLCRVLAEREIDVAASRYHYDRAPGGASRADAFRERLVRNLPEIVWTGRVHEVLVGYDRSRVAHVDGNLVVSDLRDSRGAGIRIPGRNLKVLYHQARVSDWALRPREMIYLAAESRVIMPRLAARLLELYLDVGTWAEEMAWACSMLGEICENEQDFVQACRWYERALEHYPSVLAAMRLARARFRRGMWEGAVCAYQIGVENKRRAQLLDGGEVYEDATAILVAQALRELGRHAEAAEMCRQARKRFPDSTALAELEQQINVPGVGRA